MEKGFIVACDAQIEWMLRWWWKNLRTHSSLPIAIVDLGLSKPARNWCAQNGLLIDFEPPTLELGKIPTEWLNAYGGNFEEGRRARLLKPFALKLSPFEQTVWLDLDCEVRGNISKLFGYTFAMRPERAASIKRSRELGLLGETEKLYNSGVIAYHKNSPLIEMWCKKTLTDGKDFIGDQELFSRLLHIKNLEIGTLPAIYNWRMADGTNDEAKIIHWVGHGGKRHIIEELLLSVGPRESTR